MIMRDEMVNIKRRTLMANCFMVASSAVWLPEKYPATALWKRRSCFCITCHVHGDEHSNSIKCHLYSVLIQELQLDLNVGAELLKLCLLVVEAGQGLRLL